MANGNGNGRRKSRKRLAFIGLGVVALAVVGLVAARSGGKELDPSRIAKVEKGDLARSVVATGKIEPLTKVEVKSKASGIVKRLHVHYGDRVKEGQVLAELDKESCSGARSRVARDAARRRRPSLGAQQGRGRGAGPSVSEAGARALAQALRRRADRADAARGRREGLPDGAQQADARRTSQRRR